MSAVKKCFYWGLAALVISFMAYDFVTTGRAKSDVERNPALITDLSSSTKTNSKVGIVNSQDSALGDLQASIDADLSYEQVDSITRVAVDRAGGLEDLIESGDWVVLKPNMVGFNTKGQATDIRVVKSLIEQLIEEGDADTITVAEGGAWDKNTNDPNGWTKKWEQYGNLSYDDMISNFNDNNPDILVNRVDLNYADYKEREVPGGGMAKEAWKIPNIVVNCDKMISVPVVKTHHRPGITLAHKNYVGIAPTSVYHDPWSGTSKFAPEPGMTGIYHGNNRIERVIVDLVSFHPPELTVAECFLGMEGKGPSSGIPIKRNYVMASKDPVALDVVGSKASGHNPEDIQHIKLSRNKGFGNFDMENITIRGQSIKDIYYEFDKAEHEGEPEEKYDVVINGEPTYYGRGNKTWLINGKYEGTDIEKEYIENESSLSPEAGDINSNREWKKHTFINDYIDLNQYWKEDYNQSVTYAYTEITSEKGQEVYLRFGADDGIKIWLNGEEQYSNSDMGEFNLVEESIPVELEEGKNRLLLKIMNETNEYIYAMSVSEKDGDTPNSINYNVTGSSSIVENDNNSNKFKLKQNYPNPFNPSTNIDYSLRKARNVTLTIYNIKGQKIETLVQGRKEPGKHNVKFDASEYASGVYIYRLKTQQGKNETKKMMLIK